MILRKQASLAVVHGCSGRWARPLVLVSGLEVAMPPAVDLLQKEAAL